MRRLVARRLVAQRLVARRLVAQRLVALGALGALAAGLLLVGSTTPLLFLAPWLVVLAPLLAGRYLGERSLHRLAGRLARHRAPRRRVATPIAHGLTAPLLPRGGRLLACSLAVRPPPALA
jgi:hypothetical protein